MSGVELELDDDDIQWQQWLSDLMKSSGEGGRLHQADGVCAAHNNTLAFVKLMAA